MFTGIVEALGKVVSLQHTGTNITFGIQAPFLNELKIDQSIAHNGVCLTVDGIFPDYYTVTAIKETLDKTHLNTWQQGAVVNLERCLQMGARLDGHIVQGHVDTVARVTSVNEQNGSWEYMFEYNLPEMITVPKGSICVNGVSLTVVESHRQSFSVAIIPYTWQHTNFHTLQVGSVVNLEFDIVGKYILRAGQYGLYHVQS